MENTKALREKLARTILNLIKPLGTEACGHQHYGNTGQSRLRETVGPRMVSPINLKGEKKPNSEKRGGTNRLKRDVRYITKRNV